MRHNLFCSLALFVSAESCRRYSLFMAVCIGKGAIFTHARSSNGHLSIFIFICSPLPLLDRLFRGCTRHFYFYRAAFSARYYAPLSATRTVSFNEIDFGARHGSPRDDMGETATRHHARLGGSCQHLPHAFGKAIGRMPAICMRHSRHLRFFFAGFATRCR